MDPEGAQESPPPPPKKKKRYRVSKQHCAGSLKNHKATKPAFNVRPSFKWHFAGGPMMAHL